MSIKVHPEFPDKRQFYVDGYLASRKWNDNLPQFVITDVSGRIALRIKVDPENNKVVLSSQINYVSLQINIQIMNHN